MKIKAFASRYHMTLGEGPGVLMAPQKADDWYGRNPFDATRVEGISDSLMMAPEGTTDGHNLMRDSTFVESMRVDKWVPLSPLFVKDLAGRIVYTGNGPERKNNLEWMAYQPKPGPDGQLPETDLNPFAPMRVFPRFCRSVESMDGEDLLEQVFLTKFRCLEMSSGFNGRISGSDDDDEFVCATYFGANLYPYKLRLDTYYIDGFKLPQTQMLYARGENAGVSPASGKRLAEQFMAAWDSRSPGMNYVDWFEALGEEQVERMFMGGCSVIPTFEACNGYHVVGKNFELEDYWPGQAVLGLHDVLERRSDKAPEGTILDVLMPGYVTAEEIFPAKVVVSDGSGYVSPNATDPLPLVPNLNLPHSRTLDDWRTTWVPTHPGHFEQPAIWGWELDTGRFMQLSGPLWDPLHYFYESVDLVLAAFAKHPVSEARPLVPVPDAMEGRFYPVVPMESFDTLSDSTYKNRQEARVLPESCLKRVSIADYACGIGYHPMPAEFEFEMDPFWFPEMHPMNRNQGTVPVELSDRVVPVITPRVTMTAYVASVDAPAVAVWWNDEGLMITPTDDPLVNYPSLVRYLLPELDVGEVMRLCPTPYLSEPTFDLKQPAQAWWDEEDTPLALEELLPNIYDALWDMRQEGAELVKMRHMVYRTMLPLYNLAWWYGWDVRKMEEYVADWIKTADTNRDPLDAV